MSKKFHHTRARFAVPFVGFFFLISMAVAQSSDTSGFGELSRRLKASEYVFEGLILRTNKTKLIDGKYYGVAQVNIIMQYKGQLNGTRVEVVRGDDPSKIEGPQTDKNVPLLSMTGSHLMQGDRAIFACTTYQPGGESRTLEDTDVKSLLTWGSVFPMSREYTDSARIVNTGLMGELAKPAFETKIRKALGIPEPNELTKGNEAIFRKAFQTPGVIVLEGEVCQHTDFKDGERVYGKLTIDVFKSYDPRYKCRQITFSIPALGYLATDIRTGEKTIRNEHHSLSYKGYGLFALACDERHEMQVVARFMYFTEGYRSAGLKIGRRAGFVFDDYNFIYPYLDKPLCTKDNTAEVSKYRVKRY